MLTTALCSGIVGITAARRRLRWWEREKEEETSVTYMIHHPLQTHPSSLFGPTAAQLVSPVRVHPTRGVSTQGRKKERKHGGKRKKHATQQQAGASNILHTAADKGSGVPAQCYLL